MSDHEELHAAARRQSRVDQAFELAVALCKSFEIFQRFLTGKVAASSLWREVMQGLINDGYLWVNVDDQSVLLRALNRLGASTEQIVRTVKIVSEARVDVARVVVLVN